MFNPPFGVWKIYIISKGKTNFSIKKSSKGSPYFFYKFSKSPLPPEYVNKKFFNFHVYTCSLIILCENFKMFEPSGSKVWIFFRLEWGGEGSTQKFFWEDFTLRLTFWVGCIPIDESADFTILCGETFLKFLTLELVNNTQYEIICIVYIFW